MFLSDTINELNPTKDELFALNTIYAKLHDVSFPGTRFNCGKQILTEYIFRNARCCMAENVNPAVAIAEAIDESGWFQKGILFGIKASEQDIKYDNAEYKITHEVLDDDGLFKLKKDGRLIEGVPIDGKPGYWNCKIKDWFYVPNKAFNMPTFLALHFDKYYDFMLARATNHGFKLSEVSKTVDSYIDFLMAKDEKNNLFPYATGVKYGDTIKTIIRDNGLEGFNKI